MGATRHVSEFEAAAGIAFASITAGVAFITARVTLPRSRNRAVLAGIEWTAN
jgi:hypothetical protein